ncbi:hypothetical protein NQ314_009186 [Rhamnusium bicolor]|uniref:HMG box domain-containing protein n=1 Tax=Rhamnusium bicolor TaxID=1586634 RepID=A0AAV8Y2F0_9CUCU|nr:hypothetical protein NQ314_009186 [Rhamnusium bicolor]
MSFRVDSREALKQLKIPEKPKKPLTPYVKFVIESRSDIIKQNPNIKPTEIIKKCAEHWRTVSSELKEKYANAYKSECEVYNKKILNFNASLTTEQREAIKSAADEKKEDKKKRKLRKVSKWFLLLL